jgi:hypothetical protein
MTISYDYPQEPKQNTAKKKSSWKQFTSSFRVESQDLPFAVGGTGLACYLGFTDPALLATILMSIVIAGSLYFMGACLPLISKKFKFRVSIWHLLTVICVFTLTFGAWQPSHALFLTGLQTAITTLVSQGGVSSVSTTQIATLFTFVRIALVLVGIGGGFAAWQQQQQGQSMTPIIMFVGGLFGIVLAIDIMTAVIATGQ